MTGLNCSIRTLLLFSSYIFFLRPAIVATGTHPSQCFATLSSHCFATIPTKPKHYS